ncbi:hypothetical protein [Paracidobacterium acidisoli]|uniref:Uncharacterized protein n=1 Tax=Paracidobacterium acidisoli TaxID=2303751 RepID=A0A372IJF7_9BACT|nr:hypothetical protein [Paracidobacterium acidisoli]MBT9333235.1 hypothetical protein [Paracidobacterium acidisoli]
MKFTCTGRARYFWFTLAFLWLGIAVFAWGLEYKLSLYDPPQSITRKMPEAKLLSKNEHATVTEHAAVSENDLRASSTDFHWSVFTVFLVFLLLAADYAATSQDRAPETESPWKLRQTAALNAFFFRPPPALS